MDHKLRASQRLRSSSFSSKPRPEYYHQDRERIHLLRSRSLSAPPDGHMVDLSYLNKPWPKPASETPVTVTDAIWKINHHILRSCAAAALNEPEEALAEANYALYLGEARGIFHLQSKSQLYRGLALMELERWEEASAAFTMAANVRAWAGRVPDLKMKAESKIKGAE